MVNPVVVDKQNFRVVYRICSKCNVFVNICVQETETLSATDSMATQCTLTVRNGQHLPSGSGRTLRRYKLSEQRSRETGKP